MAALGGTVFRATRKSVGHEQHERDVESIKAHIAQLKAEQAKAGAEQKEKIKSKIDALDKKLNAKLEQARQMAKQQEKEADAKVNALEKKVAKAKGEAKAKIEARIAEIKEENEKNKAAFEKWTKKNQEDVEKSMTGKTSTGTP